MYGLLAEFGTPQGVANAVRRLRADGYSALEVYAPFPIEGLRAELGRTRRSGLPLMVLMGGLAGAAVGYFMQYYLNAVDYPLNVGGRPLNSWPAFGVFSFQLAVLFGGLAAVIGLFALTRLPMPHHPLFQNTQFSLASRDRILVCVRAADPQFDPIVTRQLLIQLHASEVAEVPDVEP